MKPRKHQKKPARKIARPRKLRFKLTAEGQPMLVDYTPDWMGGEFATGHFEFRSPHNPPRRIPVSPTGYRSLFAPMPDIEAEASPQEYARLVALASIRRIPRPGAPNDSGKQLSIFALLDR